jgi:hypothetical protein
VIRVFFLDFDVNSKDCLVVCAAGMHLLHDPLFHVECGKVFCRACIIMTNRLNVFCCPGCESTLPAEGAARPPAMLSEMIQHAKGKCPHCRMDKKMEFSAFAAHLQSDDCVVPCVQGCGVDVYRRDLKTHTTVTCTHQLVLCSNQGCNMKVPQAALSQHLTGCASRVTACSGAPMGCVFQDMREPLTLHETTCDKAEIQRIKAQLVAAALRTKQHEVELAHMVDQIAHFQHRRGTKRKTVEENGEEDDEEEDNEDNEDNEKERTKAASVAKRTRLSQCKSAAVMAATAASVPVAAAPVAAAPVAAAPVAAAPVAAAPVAAAGLSPSFSVYQTTIRNGMHVYMARDHAGRKIINLGWIWNGRVCLAFGPSQLTQPGRLPPGLFKKPISAPQLGCQVRHYGTVDLIQHVLKCIDINRSPFSIYAFKNANRGDLLEAKRLLMQDEEGNEGNEEDEEKEKEEQHSKNKTTISKHHLDKDALQPLHEGVIAGENVGVFKLEEDDDDDDDDESAYWVSLASRGLRKVMYSANRKTLFGYQRVRRLARGKVHFSNIYQEKLLRQITGHNSAAYLAQHFKMFRRIGPNHLALIRQHLLLIDQAKGKTDE